MTIAQKKNYFKELLKVHDIKFDDLTPHDIGIIKYYINLLYKTNFVNYPYGLHDHLNSLSKKDIKLF
jgi:hypothetical protein